MVDWLTDPVMCSGPLCWVGRQGVVTRCCSRSGPGSWHTAALCWGGRWAMGTVHPLPVHLFLPLRVGWSGKLELLLLMVGWWELLMGLTEQSALPGTDALRFDHHHPLSIISFLPSFFPPALISISLPEFPPCTTQCMHCVIQTLSCCWSCCCCHLLSNFQTSELIKIDT